MKIEKRTGYNRPLEVRPRGKFSSGGKTVGPEPELPRLSVSECLHYTLTANPDVALLGLSYPNEQDAAFEALGTFRPPDSRSDGTNTSPRRLRHRRQRPLLVEPCSRGQP